MLQSHSILIAATLLPGPIVAYVEDGNITLTPDMMNASNTGVLLLITVTSGSDPETVFETPKPLSDVDIESITFHDNDRCSGGGANGEVTVTANEFFGTACAMNRPESSALPRFVDLLGTAVAVTIKGHLNGC